MANKLIAYYNPSMRPNPTTPNIDGMWITREEPYRVVKVWQTNSERPKLAEEPSHIRGYAAFMAHQFFEFRPEKKRAGKKKDLGSRI